MKKFIVFILFGFLMYSSVRYSDTVYRFYIRTYYNHFYTEDELVKKGWALYDDGKYEKLREYLGPLLDIYVWNNELKRIAGLNYIKLGEPVRGAEIYASSFENGSGESADLMKVLKILFQSGNYGEVVFFYDKNLMRNNVNTAFYYGASLYHLGRNRESLSSLMFARANGFIGDEIDYYTGLALESEGRLKEAAAMLRSAHETNSYNKDIRKALIRVYRKSGDYWMAELLLRKR